MDSTNAEALRGLAAGAERPFWLRAERQTAGRGGGGRAWSAAEGDLMTSLALDPARLRPAASPAEIATLSFAAALALDDAVRRLAPTAPLALKWPNDLLLSGRKLAGILLETGPGGLVIGFGVNLVGAPPSQALEPAAMRPATLSEILTPPPTPEVLLVSLAAAMGRWAEIWAAEGFGGLRPAWLARAAGLGRPIVARLADRQISGLFADVDASGALVIETRNGPRRAPAADVFFPSPSEA